MSERIECFVGSGNVYADLGFENAEEMQAKSRLMSAIERVMRRRGLSEAEAAEALGVESSEMPLLRDGHFHDTPIETLQKGLRRLSDSGAGGQSGGAHGGAPLAAAGGERGVMDDMNRRQAEIAPPHRLRRHARLQPSHRRQRPQLPAPPAA